MTRLYIVLIITALAACSQHTDNVPVPRRTAYPRICLYDDSLRTVHVAGVAMAVNADATIGSHGDGWLDVIYPRYNAAINLSVRHLHSGAELTHALANRAERIDLNLGNNRALSSEFTLDNGFNCRLIESIDGGPFPAQFVAWKPDGTMVSGATVIYGPTEPADSTAPIVKALQADTKRLIFSLSEP